MNHGKRGWRRVRVGDLVRQEVLLVTDGYRVKNEELGPQGIPFVRGGDIGNGTIETSVKDHIRPEFAERVHVKLSNPGDVAFIAKGTVGRVGFLKGNQPPIVFAPQVCVWRSLDDQKLNPRFVFYLLKSSAFQEQLNAVKTHGAMAADYVSITDQSSFWLEIPPVSTQREIASVLGVLDDKIELNRRTSAILDEMAQALFRSWFVDFDPVHASREGRSQAGLSKEALRAFPREFVSSPMGEIPRSWSFARLGEVCERVAMGPFGSDIKTENFVKFGVPVIRGGNLAGTFVDEPFVFLTPAKADELKNANARANDIVITHRGTLGQVSIIPRRSSWERYVISQSQMVLTVNTTLASPQWVFEYLRSFEGRNRLLANTNQTGVPAIAQPTSSVKSIPVLVPLPAVVQLFEDAVSVWRDRAYQCVVESRTLAALRDTLLPKLLSGELRIRDAEKAVGEAT